MRCVGKVCIVGAVLHTCLPLDLRYRETGVGVGSQCVGAVVAHLRDDFHSIDTGVLLVDMQHVAVHVREMRGIIGY